MIPMEVNVLLICSAFSMKRYPFFIKSSQATGPPANNQFAQAVRQNTEATVMRQSAEWI
jgi:hypothetical protein